MSDVFVLNIIELFHGWKIYDFLVYSRYRFLNREKRWKGLEPNVDECLEESMRSLDQMCFSSQLYMMCTLHVSAIMILTLSIEIMARQNYNMFGDPATPILACYVLCFSVLVEKIIIYLAIKYKVWKVRHEDTAWHAMPGEGDENGIPRWEELEKIKGASHEAYLMNQRMTSETFRYKFLNYNRPWIIQQLPSILTPRTLRRGKPYLISQFTKILSNLNPDVSSDDDDDDQRPRFGPVSLSASSRNIIRLWLAKARRRRRLLSSVQPIINQNRKAECQVCLSRRQLQVELVIPLEIIGEKFERNNKSEEFDVKAWKDFFKKHQKFRTLCLSCATKEKLGQPIAHTSLQGQSYSDDENNSAQKVPQFPPIYLNAASNAIMRKWYRRAQDRVFGRYGKLRTQVSVSDDEDEMPSNMEWTRKPLNLNAASTAIVRKWFNTAKSRLKVKISGAKIHSRNEPIKPARKRPTRKAISLTSKKSRNRRK